MSQQVLSNEGRQRGLSGGGEVTGEDTLPNGGLDGKVPLCATTTPRGQALEKEQLGGWGEGVTRTNLGCVYKPQPSPDHRNHHLLR